MALNDEKTGFVRRRCVAVEKTGFTVTHCCRKDWVCKEKMPILLGIGIVLGVKSFRTISVVNGESAKDDDVRTQSKSPLILLLMLFQ